MSKYRKKPVVIEAMRYTGTPDTCVAIHEWCGYQHNPEAGCDSGIYIDTLEGQMRADVGDWIIRGIQGEFYPCKPDVFEATYEAVMDEASRAPQPIEDERRIPGFAERERGAQAAWEFFARDDRDMSHDFRAGYHQGTIDEARRKAPADPAVRGEWEYGIRSEYDEIPLTELWATYDAARARARNTRGEWVLIRRRKAGPWEPVPRGADDE